MPTNKQKLGQFGEKAVVKGCICPKCREPKTLKQLPTNFKCADIICDFCGYLAQVKAKNVSDIDLLPKQIPGAAWKPHQARMDAGIYIALYIILVTENFKSHAIYYLAGNLQRPEIFKPRAPLSPAARRPGWTGFIYDLTSVRTAFERLK